MEAAAEEARVSLEERLRFIRITSNDADLLESLAEPLAAQVDRVVNTFYTHLEGFDSLRPLLSDPQTVERLKGSLKKYLLSLTSGVERSGYQEERLHIGRVHEQIGLLPQWTLGSYCFFLEELYPIVMHHYQANPAKGMQACLAMTKLMNLDSQIILDAYFETRQQRALERSEHLAAIGELAASIAHEVRNPLAGMKGAMEVLREHLTLDPSKAEVVDELMAQIVRLENLVRDLLTFAQPRPLALQPVELQSLLDRVLRLIPKSIEISRISVIRDYDDRMPPIQADPQQLEQVFLNLVQNAIQAMDGEGTLTISAAPANGSMDIVFQDTGPGIRPADLLRIFQPFFTTRHRGSGLGLAIVRKIVEAHGGTVRVQSKPGEGTTATITLPVRGGG